MGTWIQKLHTSIDVCVTHVVLQDMRLELDDAGAFEVPDDDVWQTDSDNDDTADDDGDAPIPSALRLHPRDLGNFMKLSRALMIFMSDELTTAQVEEADSLLRAYCIELIEVRVS